MPNNDDFLWVVTAEQGSEDLQTYNNPDRGIHEITQKMISKGVKIPAEKLKSSFHSFFRTVISLIDEIPEVDSNYVVDEIQIQAEVSAEGKIQLVGGITTGTKGGISFKLKRKVQVENPPSAPELGH